MIGIGNSMFDDMPEYWFLGKRLGGWLRERKETLSAVLDEGWSLRYNHEDELRLKCEDPEYNLRVILTRDVIETVERKGKYKSRELRARKKNGVLHIRKKMYGLSFTKAQIPERKITSEWSPWILVSNLILEKRLGEGS